MSDLNNIEVLVLVKAADVYDDDGDDDDDDDDAVCNALCDGVW